MTYFEVLHGIGEKMEELTLKTILHTFGQSILNPCIVILLALLVITVWQIGDLLVEFLIERRSKKKKENVPELVKTIARSGRSNLDQVIINSKLLKRQKKFAFKLIEADGLSENSMAALAQKLLSIEDGHYRRVLMPTDLIAKVAPMFGLLSTLIPLGPGIVALGKGDVKTLSDSIGIAFDTTIAGITAAAVCFAISYLRGHWYEEYTATNEALAEALIDRLIGDASAR